MASYVALQPHYNLMERGWYEGELAAVCERHGLACVPYFGLARGFLTGKYRRDGKEIDSPRAAGVRESYFNERGFAVLDALDEIAAAHQHGSGGRRARLAARPADGPRADRQRHLPRAAGGAAGLDRARAVDRGARASERGERLTARRRAGPDPRRRSSSAVGEREQLPVGVAHGQLLAGAALQRRLRRGLGEGALERVERGRVAELELDAA